MADSKVRDRFPETVMVLRHNKTKQKKQKKKKERRKEGRGKSQETWRQFEL